MTLNYNYPSGVSGAPTPSPIPVTYDQSYDKTLPTPTPLTGTDYKYTFAGWYEGAEDKPVSTTDPNGVTYKEIKASDTIKSEKDFIIHARWTYEVTLDPDGGTVTPEKATLTTGTAVGGLPTPKKDGYEFEGWFTDSNCTEVNKVTDESIANSANKTFYAKWEAKTYTVTLDPNGGELTDDKKTVTVTYGVAYPNLKSDNVPTYIGYEFTGWFTEKDGGTEVTNSTKVTETGNHILYAHWKPRTYDVTLNYNVPTLDPEYNPVVKKLSGIDIDAKLQGLPSKSQVPGYEYKDTKFTFYNWYTKDGAMVNSQTPLTPDMLNDKKDGVNLNARWEYGIKFYYNTGTSSSASRPNETVNFITDTPYGNKLPTPTNTGKTLLGWFTAADNTGKQVSASDTAKGDITELYAHWTTSEYVVTLDDNGGKFRDDQKIRSHPYQYGDTYGDFVTNTDYIPDPPAGHTFIGWYTEKEGGTMLTSSTRFTESCTIFAHWKADQFKVTLDLGYDSNTTVHTVDYDTELSKVLPSPEPDRTGYAFEGWFEDKAFTKPADTKLKIQADITLYAKWKEAKRVSLDVGGGKLPENTPAYINVYEGGTYAKLPTPTWPGSIFKGWWTQKTGGKQVKPSDTVPAPSSIPVTLYARWESKKITVYLDYNGAPGEAGRTITCSVGDTYKSLPTYLSWAGHEFMGWYTKETGGEKVEKTTIVSVPSDDVEELTLFAHWGYTVVFEPGDGSGTMDKVAAEMDQPYTLPECTFTAPDGMRFGGWAIGSPDAPTQPAGSQYTVVRNLALYATWTDKPITITVTCTSGGSLATDDGKTNTVTAERGTDVTFIARPNAGYELKDLQVDGVSYNYTVEYTFRRIEEDHKIHAVFGRIDAPSYSSCDHGTNCPLSGYRDLNSNAWYHDAVHFCMDNVIMGGSNNSFKPNAKATRAEVATSLWSAEGREPVSGNGPLSKTYPDVAVSDWYYQPIEWATRRGILAGYSNGRFGPNDFITREQLVSVLWRHAGSPKPRNTVLRFNDASKVSGFAWDAMLWATERGIISGRPGGYLAPKGNATRADVAQVLKNYLN
ncbi:InlB B-repeat-containing protein [Acutalibacter sp.]|uniref:InlB B-repeat-containing protein n=1 Tax=Acutalibacter sp. TaxID=1918636 RepID=UPI0025C6A5A9|nr:InlB B-repeat-containing protein [Acutalibacter sp.]